MLFGDLLGQLLETAVKRENNAAVFEGGGIGHLPLLSGQHAVDGVHLIKHRNLALISRKPIVIGELYAGNSCSAAVAVADDVRGELRFPVAHVHLKDIDILPRVKRLVQPEGKGLAALQKAENRLHLRFGQKAGKHRR